MGNFIINERSVDWRFLLTARFLGDVAFGIFFEHKITIFVNLKCIETMKMGKTSFLRSLRASHVWTIWVSLDPFAAESCAE
jgi:hypothetical protein